MEFLFHDLGRSVLNTKSNFLHISLTFMIVMALNSLTFIINFDPYEITQEHPLSVIIALLSMSITSTSGKHMLDSHRKNRLRTVLRIMLHVLYELA